MQLPAPMCDNPDKLLFPFLLNEPGNWLHIYVALILVVPGILFYFDFFFSSSFPGVDKLLLVSQRLNIRVGDISLLDTNWGR